MRIPFIERTDSRKTVSPLTLVGLLLVPLVVAGLLIWALWNPADRLDSVKAAIVNHDEPVTLNGQTVPLGRQLGAGLVSGGDSANSDDSDADDVMNYTWVVTDASDAAAGLKDGEYTAVVTIPENFSEAATSYSGEPADAEQALIDVTTSESGRLIDGAISQAVTTTAADVMSKTLTTTYLDNIYLGFNSLHDQLGDAADGAAQLADGSAQLADGTAQAADGAGQLAANSEQLVSGAQGLADGASGIADGASTSAAGASGLSTGASQAASGAARLSGGASALSTGLQSLVDGLAQLKKETAGLPAQTQALADGAAGLSTGIAGVTTTITDTMAPLAEKCTAGDEDSCLKLADTVTATATADQDGDNVADVTALSAGAAKAATGTQTLADGMQKLTDGIAEAADGAAPIPAGASDLADGAKSVSDGVAKLSGGASQLAGGLGQLSGGASQLATGAEQYATGVGTYTDGVTSLSDALAQLSDGTAELDDGTQTLADGLGTAVDQIPSYSESERESLADVVAQPVSTSGDDADALNFGSGGLPLYAVIALWLGTFATFFLLRAVPSRTLGSTRSPLALTLRTAAPGLVLGALQGVLVSVVLSIAQGHSFGQWLGTAAIAVLIGAAFAAVNQALVAVFGGTGRFIAMVVALVALATGIISTVPGALDSAFAMLPVSPAKLALESAVLGSGNLAGAVVGIAVWLVGALAVTTLSVALRRTVPARKLAASPA